MSGRISVTPVSGLLFSKFGAAVATTIEFRGYEISISASRPYTIEQEKLGVLDRIEIRVFKDGEDVTEQFQCVMGDGGSENIYRIMLHIVMESHE